MWDLYISWNSSPLYLNLSTAHVLAINIALLVESPCMTRFLYIETFAWLHRGVRAQRNAASCHQNVILAWSFFALKKLPGTILNGTIVLIIYYNMISNVFCSLSAAGCVRKMLAFSESGLCACEIFRCTSPLWYCKTSAGATAVNITAQTWSVITTVLDMNICTAFISLS